MRFKKNLLAIVYLFVLVGVGCQTKQPQIVNNSSISTKKEKNAVSSTIDTTKTKQESVVVETVDFASGIKLFKNIEYAKISGVDKKYLSLDLYVPTGFSGKLPLIIFVHGGGWRNDDKILGQVYAVEAIKNGFAFASLNYRLSSTAVFPAAIYDIKAAIRWLRQSAGYYNLDTDKFGLLGGSAGGHLVSFVGVSDNTVYEGSVGVSGYSSRVQAVVDWFGPTDFEAVIAQKDKYQIYYQAAGQFVGGVGAKLENNLSAAKSASPLMYISSDDPPFLIMHGENDSTVPVEQSREFYKSLKQAKVDVTYKEYKDIDHYFPENSEYTGLVFKFFKDKLR